MTEGSERVEYTNLPSSCHVILNGVKNLETSTNAFQILRFAQDDNMIKIPHP